MNTREFNEIYLLKKYILSNLKMNINIEIEMKLEFILGK
jgi:hypothetical protein